MNLLKDLAPAVRKETKRVSIFTFSGVAVMWIAFAVLHACIPEKIPFDHTVILAGLIGGFIAALNFFLMGVTVQKVSAETNEDNARLRMKASHSPPDPSPDGMGDRRHRGSLFSVCRRNSSPALPELRDQAYGIDS